MIGAVIATYLIINTDNEEDEDDECDPDCCGWHHDEEDDEVEVDTSEITLGPVFPEKGERPIVHGHVHFLEEETMIQAFRWSSIENEWIFVGNIPYTGDRKRSEDVTIIEEPTKRVYFKPEVQ